MVELFKRTETVKAAVELLPAPVMDVMELRLKQALGDGVTEMQRPSDKVSIWVRAEVEHGLRLVLSATGAVDEYICLKARVDLTNYQFDKLVAPDGDWLRLRQLKTDGSDAAAIREWLDEAITELAAWLQEFRARDVRIRAAAAAWSTGFPPGTPEFASPTGIRYEDGDEHTACVSIRMNFPLLERILSARL